MEQKQSAVTSAVAPDKGWSWGAFMFGIPFLIAIKQYKMLWWFLLSLVPIVNVVFYVVFAIYMGLHGHELAAKSTHFGNEHEYRGFIKAIDHSGRILFFVVLIGLALFALLAIVGVLHFFTWGFLRNGSAPFMPRY